MVYYILLNKFVKVTSPIFRISIFLLRVLLNMYTAIEFKQNKTTFENEHESYDGIIVPEINMHDTDRTSTVMLVLQLLLDSILFTE